MHALKRLGSILVLVVLGGSLPAQAAGGNVTYGGSTDEGRSVKLVVNPRGEVVRGVITATTVCSGNFEPFRARVEFNEPFDESTRDGFAGKGSTLDQDGRFSGRYKYEVEGKRGGPRKFEGSISVDVVFRKDGEKYVTCEAHDIGFRAEELKQRK